MKKRTALMMVLLTGNLLTGCGSKEPEKVEEPNPACAELAWTTDPKKQEALLEKCPKGLPEGYKPSQKKSW
jgi:entry exclusion lipoprotein TrbK